MLLSQFFLLMCLVSSQAFFAKHEFHSFEDAEQAKSFLRFEVESNKLGIFSSTVVGYVTKFEGTGNLEKGNLTNASVRFLVRNVDTDLYARNDVLWNQCLSYKTYPEIIITVPAIHWKEGELFTTTARISLRGEVREFPVTLRISRANEHWIVEGDANLSFRELQIPDPSIGLANVKDKIHVTFRIEETSP